jgi:hypothetical protein
MLPFIVLAGYCLQPGANAQADETKISVEDLMSEFDKDAKLAKEKYAGKALQMEVTLQKVDFIEDGKKWAMVKGGPAGGKNLKSGFFLRLKNQYRSGDQIVVNATLKSAVWTEDSKRLFFDPCTIEKEIEVQPPIFVAEKFLIDYKASPKKMAEKHEGKRVQIKGQVQFIADGGLVLCYAPLLDAKGRIVKTSRGYDRLGRALLTVRFADAATVSKLNPNRGTGIEIEGTVSEMKAGKILITDAKMLK